VSAKNRKKKSDILDRYYTPMALAIAGFGHLQRTRAEFMSGVTSLLEPGSGPGTFCSASRGFVPNLKGPPVGVDMVPPETLYPGHKCVRRNFLDWKTKQRFDLAITNPPFTYVNVFIRKTANLLTPQGLAVFLMRVGVAGGLERMRMWQEEVNLIEVCMVAPRPGFTYDGETDASEYALFLFNGQKGPCSQETRLTWLRWDNG
jgi:hypothetical protein